MSCLTLPITGTIFSRFPPFSGTYLPGFKRKAAGPWSCQHSFATLWNTNGISSSVNTPARFVYMDLLQSPTS